MNWQSTTLLRIPGSHCKVYDMTEFASDHPAGPEPVTKLSGSDGTETFSKVHTESMLDEFTPLGVLGSV